MAKPIITRTEETHYTAFWEDGDEKTGMYANLKVTSLGRERLRSLQNPAAGEERE